MKALGQILLVLVLLYVTSYIVLRSRWTHRWDQDGKAYMHFPVSSKWAYYLYRPVCVFDETVSGMSFHIGPHPGTETDADLVTTGSLLPASASMPAAASTPAPVPTPVAAPASDPAPAPAR